MIAEDLVYLRPESGEEAVLAYAERTAPERGGIEGVHYYGGGTELVTGARRSAKALRVLIDVKGIDEARRLGSEGGRLYFGAALSLSEVADSDLFPALGALIRHIADRTTRNRLSLGGNIAGALPYREAALPLLLAGATVHSILPAPASAAGAAQVLASGFPTAADTSPAPLRRERPLVEAFDKRLRLEPGELLLGFSLDASLAERPFRAYRATRTGPVDYPLVSSCFLASPPGQEETGPTLALSGLHPYPVPYASLAAARTALMPSGVAKSDQRAQADYRLALALDMIARADKELS